MLRVITRGDTVQNNRARRIYRCHQISGASLHQSIVILLGTRAEVQLVLHMYVPISTVLLTSRHTSGFVAASFKSLMIAAYFGEVWNSKW